MKYCRKRSLAVKELALRLEDDTQWGEGGFTHDQHVARTVVWMKGFFYFVRVVRTLFSVTVAFIRETTERLKWRQEELLKGDSSRG